MVRWKETPQRALLHTEEDFCENRCAAHYWDADGKLRVAYQRLMKMDELAWDAYYVYGRDAEWKNSLPPLPVYYMHQLRSLPPERMLDGEKLAGEMKKLLEQTK
jgi:hypothetical protein